MPWMETNPMDQRLRFLEDVRLARMSMTELCAHFQISRKTGYKWIDREAEEGRRGSCGRRGWWRAHGNERGSPRPIRSTAIRSRRTWWRASST